MSTSTPPNPTCRYAQEELVAELRRRFGDDPMAWAFICPACRDQATGQDFKDALAARPQTRKDGTPVAASDYLGLQCIGRVTGALDPARWKGWTTAGKPKWRQRGCDWAAHGLLGNLGKGITLVLPDGREVGGFAIGEAAR